VPIPTSCHPGAAPPFPELVISVDEYVDRDDEFDGVGMRQAWFGAGGRAGERAKGKGSVR
jgi:hypothetical protein